MATLVDIECIKERFLITGNNYRFLPTHFAYDNPKRLSEMGRLKYNDS